MARKRRKKPVGKTTTKRRRRRSSSKRLGSITASLQSAIMPVAGAIAYGFMVKFLKNDDGTDKFFKGSSQILPMAAGAFAMGNKQYGGFGLGLLVEAASAFAKSTLKIGNTVIGSTMPTEEEFARLAQSLNGFNDNVDLKVLNGFNDNVDARKIIY